MLWKKTHQQRQLLRLFVRHRSLQQTEAEALIQSGSLYPDTHEWLRYLRYLSLLLASSLLVAGIVFFMKGYSEYRFIHRIFILSLRDFKLPFRKNYLLCLGMRPYLISIILLLICSAGLAQQLPTSLQQSPYTYIFRLDTETACQAYNCKLDSIYPAFLQHKVDSFLNGSYYRKTLPKGNYLWLSVKGNQLISELQPIHSLNVQLLPHKKSLVLSIRDSVGQIITHAHAWVDGKALTLHKPSGTYRRAFRKGYSLIEIQVDGHHFFYPLNPTQQYGSFLGKAYRKIIYFKPVYFIWKPFRDIVQSIRFGYPEGWLTIFSPEDYGKTFDGYLSLNKPAY